MTSLEVALCKDVLQEYYGDVVSAVGGYLVSNGRSSLSKLAKNTSCKTDQVRKRYFRVTELQNSKSV